MDKKDNKGKWGEKKKKEKRKKFFEELLNRTIALKMSSTGLWLIALGALIQLGTWIAYWFNNNQTIRLPSWFYILQLLGWGLVVIGLLVDWMNHGKTKNFGGAIRTAVEDLRRSPRMTSPRRVPPADLAAMRRASARVVNDL